MSTLKFIFFTFIFILQFEVSAFPCRKYKFDFNQEVASGTIVVSWSINTGFNSCSQFKKQDINKHSFIITVSNLLDNVLLSDTIAQNWFVFNVLESEEFGYNVKVSELNGSESISEVFKRVRHPIPGLHSQIDSLNFYLVHGLFPNALHQIRKLNLEHVIDSVMHEYSILFPDHYPDNKDFFNCYIDPESLLLKKMSYAGNLIGFSKLLNRSTKKLTDKPQDLYVNISIQSDHTIAKVEVYPNELASFVLNALTALKFDNVENQNSIITLLVTRRKNGRFYYVKNTRALTNPNTSGFQKRYPYTGPIH